VTDNHGPPLARRRPAQGAQADGLEATGAGGPSLDLDVDMTGQTFTVETLEDWVRAGAHWRVIHHGERRAIVELQQCTGEPVERLESDDPAVIAYLEGIECDLDLTTAGGGGDRG
jgi:hypothetical protein